MSYFILFYIYLGIFTLIAVLIYIIQNPTIMFVPYNLFIEHFYENKVFYSKDEKEKLFPDSIKFEKEWINIRNEAIRLFKKKKYDNVGKNFISNDDQFWQGWETIPLKIFDKTYPYLDECPTVKRLLTDKIPTAFFSIMHPKKKLDSHYGPFKGILRYHLGLSIPEGDCFISVNNEIYSWKEGEGILFDETYKHFVINDTEYPRIILFLDVKRDMKNLNWLNDLILYLISISPYN